MRLHILIPAELTDPGVAGVVVGVFAVVAVFRRLGIAAVGAAQGVSTVVISSRRDILVLALLHRHRASQLFQLGQEDRGVAFVIGAVFSQQTGKCMGRTHRNTTVSSGGELGESCWSDTQSTYGTLYGHALTCDG